MVFQGGLLDRMLSIGHGSPGIHELIIKCINAMKYEDYDFPSEIEQRGVKNIPNYHFRDDALKIWDAIREYVTSVLAFFYTSDVDVQMDCELQDWVYEMHRYKLVVRVVV